MIHYMKFGDKEYRLYKRTRPWEKHYLYDDEILPDNAQTIPIEMYNPMTGYSYWDAVEVSIGSIKLAEYQPLAGLCLIKELPDMQISPKITPPETIIGDTDYPYFTIDVSNAAHVSEYLNTTPFEPPSDEYFNGLKSLITTL